MFCPECGTQNPDPMRFCVSCGYQNPLAGGAARTQPMVGAAPSGSKSNALVIGGGILALLIIGGLVAFIALRGSGSSDQDNAPAPRAKTVANASPAASAPTQPVASAPAASSPLASSTPTVATTAPAPPAPKATPKPVNCDKKCYQVYDQCMADYRQHADPETICRGRQTTCLSKC